MNTRNLRDLREVYMIAYSNFSTDRSEVVSILNEDGHLGSPDQAKRAVNRMFSQLEERGLLVSTDVNGEAQGNSRQGAFKELTWQASPTYDEIDEGQALALFEQLYATEIEVLTILPRERERAEAEERLPGEIDARTVQVGDIIELGSKRIRSKVYSVQVTSDTVAIGYFILSKDGRQRPTEQLVFHPIGKPITLVTPSNNKKEPTVATVVKSKKGKTATKKTTAKTAPAKASTNGGSSKTRRTAEEVRALVPKFRKHLNAGGSMKDLKVEHGFSDDGPIRSALYFEGFDSKGNEHGEEQGSIDAGKAAGKKQVVKLREEGAAWFRLSFLTGLPESALKAIVTEAGGNVSGRVYKVSDKPAKAAAKTAPKASKATAKPASKKTRKATKADPS